MRRDIYFKSVKQTLTMYWNDVRDLSPDECYEMINLFINYYVRDDFKQKFIQYFGKGKPKTAKYFRNYEILDDIKISILELFSIKEIQNIEVLVMWGFEYPEAFCLKGKPSTVGNIFIEEGDALAKIIVNNKIVYLFLDGHRDVLFKFPKKFVQD